ncbi:MAG: ferredoxin [Proteobacteria bacterium]|nr:ferredoxin [Pseudomonadota bacterium]
MFKILHYRERCIGCNICVELAPNRWRMSKKDGKAVLLGGVEKNGIYQISISELELNENELAREACPVKVIQIR